MPLDSLLATFWPKINSSIGQNEFPHASRHSAPSIFQCELVIVIQKERAQRGPFLVTRKSSTMEGINLLEVEEESFELFKLGWIGRSILVVVLVASLATTIFVKGNVARFVLFFAPKERPLNIIIMIDQVQQT